MKDRYEYINRDVSWLNFNERVLQEAEDPSVPLLTRLRFIGIFANNLDEFLMVRYATVKRIVHSGKTGVNALGQDASELLRELTGMVIRMQKKSQNLLRKIHKELEKENIFFIDERKVSEEQQSFLENYFTENVSTALPTFIVDNLDFFPLQGNTVVYLAVKLVLGRKTEYRSDNSNLIRYALIEIPPELGRFIVLPETWEGKRQVMLLEDLIRFSLNGIFGIFDYRGISAHMIKITRDAELDIDNDLSKSFIEKISGGLKERTRSKPVMFIYDSTTPKDMLRFLLDKMKIPEKYSLLPCGRHHHYCDYMNFPDLGRKDLVQPTPSSLTIPGFKIRENLLQQIAEKDYLQHVPYHTFSYTVRFLREVALDPKVTSIKITVYRLARISFVAGALVNAAKNGKKVIVLIELQARFNEHSNIQYAEELKNAGAHIIFGVAGLKAHCKVCVIKREEKEGTKRYGFISTGNLNESTAKVYTDFTLFTAHQKLLKEVDNLFVFLEENYRVQTYQHLIVSPHYTQKEIYHLIENEIAAAKAGKPAFIKARMNGLSNFPMIDKLYEASCAGVQIRLIVRGICCLIPGVKNMSENIEIISIVDQYLEHTRLFIFGNEGNPAVYISSADWMTRNIKNRVEVTCPIYDEQIKKELILLFEIAWRDNTKARIISEKQDNAYRKADSEEPIRSQSVIYEYFQKKLLSNEN